MSHFKLLVVGNNIEQLLAPFDENDRHTFKDATDDAVQLWEKYQVDHKDDGVKYTNFDEFVSKYCGYETVDGKIGYYHNPSAKWDWWVVGGRYENDLISKTGENGNSFKIKDIDFAAMMERNKTRAAEWWTESLEIEGKTFKFYAYGITEDMTRESFIESRTKFNVFAFLHGSKWVERGEMGWWGLVSNEKDENAWDDQLLYFIKSLDGEDVLTVVDCHI